MKVLDPVIGNESVGNGGRTQIVTVQDLRLHKRCRWVYRGRMTKTTRLRGDFLKIGLGAKRTRTFMGNSDSKNRPQTMHGQSHLQSVSPALGFEQQTSGR